MIAIYKHCFKHNQIHLLGKGLSLHLPQITIITSQLEGIAGVQAVPSFHCLELLTVVTVLNHLSNVFARLTKSFRYT